MPLAGSIVGSTPSQIVDNSSSSNDLIVNFQYRNSRPTYCKVHSGATAPDASSNAYLVVVPGQTTTQLRVASGERVYAWGDGGGVLIYNHY